MISGLKDYAKELSRTKVPRDTRATADVHVLSALLAAGYQVLLPTAYSGTLHLTTAVREAFQLTTQAFLAATSLDHHLSTATAVTYAQCIAQSGELVIYTTCTASLLIGNVKVLDYGVVAGLPV